MQTTLRLLLGLKIIHTVLFVLKDMLISFADSSTTLSKDCKPNHYEHEASDYSSAMQLWVKGVDCEVRGCCSLIFCQRAARLLPSTALQTEENQVATNTAAQERVDSLPVEH